MRYLALFAPYLGALVLSQAPTVSLVWSIAGAFWIAFIVHTPWFHAGAGEAPVSERLLRPITAFQFWFVATHVMGAAFKALDASGVSYSTRIVSTTVFDLVVLAEAPRLML